MSVILLKITTFFVTLGAMLVYNFHKLIGGIKTKHNIKYGKKRSFYKTYNVHYHKKDLVNLKNINNDKKQGEKANLNDKKPNLRPIIVYYHGGGWTAYSKGIYTTLCKRFASMGYVVFNVNYRLAPKTKMDGILADCVEALLQIKKDAHMFNGDKNKIVLAGDSAGAHISSFISAAVSSKLFNVDSANKIKGIKEFERYKEVLLKAKEELSNAIKGTLLFYGVYNIETMMSSGFPNIKTYAKASLYGAGYNKEENEVFSPLIYIDGNFKPCFIASGAIDKLHESQSEVLKSRLEDQKINMQNLFFGKEELRAMHAFMIFDGLYTNEQTLIKAEEFLKEIFN